MKLCISISMNSFRENDYAEPDKFALAALNFAVASLGIVYGLIGYLILIPIKTKLELYMSK